MDERFCSIREASEKLNISERKVRQELRKLDCEYGYAVEHNRKVLYCINRKLLEKHLVETVRK